MMLGLGMLGMLGGVAVAMSASANAAALLPQDYASRDLHIRFERIGYVGRVFLNADRSYVGVQTGPDRRTEAFAGVWEPHGPSGLCIKPTSGTGGKCFTEMPQRVDADEEIRSSLDELYRFRLVRDR